MRNQTDTILTVNQFYKFWNLISLVELVQAGDIPYELIKGKNGTTIFLPLNNRKCGPLGMLKTRKLIV